METPMEELIEKIEHAISYNVEGGLVEKYTWEQLFKDCFISLKKEIEYTKELKDKIESLEYELKEERNI